jgi:hypothetical protein
MLTLLISSCRYEHFDAGDGNWTNTTLLFYCFLVEVGIFEEIIISRHFVGHTREFNDHVLHSATCNLPGLICCLCYLIIIPSRE